MEDINKDSLFEMDKDKRIRPEHIEPGRYYTLRVKNVFPSDEEFKGMSHIDMPIIIHEVVGENDYYIYDLSILDLDFFIIEQVELVFSLDGYFDYEHNKEDDDPDIEDKNIGYVIEYNNKPNFGRYFKKSVDKSITEDKVLAKT